MNLNVLRILRVVYKQSKQGMAKIFGCSLSEWELYEQDEKLIPRVYLERGLASMSLNLSFYQDLLMYYYHLLECDYPLKDKYELMLMKATKGTIKNSAIQGHIDSFLKNKERELNGKSEKVGQGIVR